jgi:hypothetical protein
MNLRAYLPAPEEALGRNIRQIIQGKQVTPDQDLPGHGFGKKLKICLIG